MTATYTLAQITREVHRVFGTADVSPETTDGDLVRVLVEGWPDRIIYRTGPLMTTLARFADRHGKTEDGDSEVCSRLEEAGAFLSVA